MQIAINDHINKVFTVEVRLWTAVAVANYNSHAEGGIEINNPHANTARYLGFQ